MEFQSYSSFWRQQYFKNDQGLYELIYRFHREYDTVRLFEYTNGS